MLITVLAVGKAGQSAEAELCARYTDRATAAGRSVGLSPVSVVELPDGTGDRRREKDGARILSAHKTGPLVLLDETGRRLTSLSCAKCLTAWQSDGESGVTFAIGGADGHADAVRAAANDTWSLSDLTLPHLLARVVLLEQIYRAITIVSGHPYHRA